MFRPVAGSKLKAPRRPIVQLPARRHRSRASALMPTTAILVEEGSAVPEQRIAEMGLVSRMYDHRHIQSRKAVLLASNSGFDHSMSFAFFAVVPCRDCREVGRSAVFREAYALGQTAVFHRTCERKDILSFEQKNLSIFVIFQLNSEQPFPSPSSPCPDVADSLLAHSVLTCYYYCRRPTTSPGLSRGF